MVPSWYLPAEQQGWLAEVVGKSKAEVFPFRAFEKAGLLRDERDIKSLDSVPSYKLSINPPSVPVKMNLCWRITNLPSPLVAVIHTCSSRVK